MIRNTFKGFEFVKVGTFKLGKEPYLIGKEKTPWNSPTLCELTNENFINASCSTYVVTLGQNCTEKDILYVGIFTDTLNKRWFKNRKHEKCYISWHSDNLDNNINFLLKKLSNISTGSAQWTVGDTGNANKLDNIFKEHFELEQRITSDKKSEKEISLWLTTNPYIELLTRVLMNCSTSIEQLFLEDTENLKLPFNKKGRNRPQGRKISEII